MTSIADRNDAVHVPSHDHKFVASEVVDGLRVVRAFGNWRSASMRFELPLALADARRLGWIILHGPEVRLAANVLVPDVAGWRLSRLPSSMDFDSPMPSRPDWVCEFASKSSEHASLAKKRIYHDAGVENLWVLDLQARFLETFTRGRAGWTPCGSFNGTDIVRAAPFDAISFSFDGLFPFDPPPPAAEA